MLKNLQSSKGLLLLLLFTFSCSSVSKTDREKTIAQYLDLSREYGQLLCEKNTELNYNQLLTKFRGRGFYLPELQNEADLETIRELLPEFDKKLAWLDSEIRELKKIKNLPTSSYFTKIENKLKEALILKKTISFNVKKEELSRASVQSKKAQEEIFNLYKEILNKLSFLTHYRFPIDHLKNRKVHDDFKNSSDKSSERASNYSFMFRKLVEDGAYNPDHTGSDMFLRTTMDTLYFELQNPGIVIHENTRTDLKWVISKWKKELERGKKLLVERLKEWHERVTRQKHFYQTLLLPENRETLVSLVNEHNQATHELKNFVFERQSKAYSFWLKQSEIMRKLFVLETILYNEVGDVDAPYSLDRMDVSKIVMNRSNLAFYQSLDPKQDLYKFLLKKHGEYKLNRETWLNMLFRIGEFSFTYYYIPGVVKIFCQDKSPKGKKLQLENLEIALMALETKQNNFKATRYFSRASMLGRINMALVWDDFLPYPERAGVLEKNQEQLLKLHKSGSSDFLYAFDDPANKKYQVLEIEGKIYSATVDELNPIFYSYRNPHNFIYFVSRNGKK